MQKNINFNQEKTICMLNTQEQNEMRFREKEMHRS